jgi:hypothetical protein
MPMPSWPAIFSFWERVGNMIVRVPILTYHSLDGSGSVISTSPERFRQQMREFHVAHIQAIVAALNENRDVPESPVAVWRSPCFGRSFADPILSSV